MFARKGDLTAVSVVQYPGPIVEAALMQASRLWARRNSAFASEVGFPDSGQMTRWRGGFDPDVKDLIKPYRRIAL